MGQFRPALLADTGSRSKVGGDLCLDFANTAAWDPAGPWKEHLERFRDMVRWTREAGALPADRSARLLETSERQPDRAEAALAHGRHVRALIHDIFTRIAYNHPVVPAHLAALSDEVGHAFRSARFIQRDGRIVREWSAETEDFEQVIRPIVAAASDLLLGERVQRVRACANPQCGRLFLDESRNGMRRWCDMRVCGSRAKARRYYAKHVERDA